MLGNSFTLQIRDSLLSGIRTHGSPRSRFTLAHELGHLYLHHPGNQPRTIAKQRRSTLQNILEFEANRFASEFLMPVNLFNPKELPERNARLFQVSLEAATRRARELAHETSIDSKLPTIRHTDSVSTAKPTKISAFVSMPYSPEEQMTRLYKEIIKPAIETFGLFCVRADEVKNADTIQNIIREGIDNCCLVIAEISDLNSNVMIEIGIVQAIDKPVIIICRSTCQVPSNISSIKRIVYIDDAGGGFALRRDLELAINTIIDLKNQMQLAQ